MSIRTYERLQCPFCPGSRFMQVLSVQYHADNGVTVQPDHLRCIDCNADVDMNRMIDTHRLRKEKAELAARTKELESQYAHVAAPAAPAKPEKPATPEPDNGGTPKDANRSRR